MQSQTQRQVVGCELNHNDCTLNSGSTFLKHYLGGEPGLMNILLASTNWSAVVD